MTLHELVLTIHIACGAGGIILGPIAMRARKMPGQHTQVGEIYHWLFLVIFLTTGVLSWMNWERLWWLLPIGIFSYSFALLGYLAAKLRDKPHHDVGKEFHCFSPLCNWGYGKRTIPVCAGSK